ncbi:MAG TPA: hypothetical protein VFT73_05505, partial [Sphingomonas sp.]|nr:hypothetical protein [Sphingomonas sp.]
MRRGGGQPSLDEEGRALVGRLGGRWTANGGMCRCPAHDDRTPSLSLAPGENGRVLVHCFGGCAPADVNEALRRRGLWPARELRTPPVHRP